MLVRPAEGRGFEVLMVRRSGASHFVPHAYVFPGGTVEPSDYGFDRVFGLDDAAVRREFRMDQAVDERDAKAVVTAALRELYEEAGVLLACGPDGVSREIAEAAPANEARPSYTDALQRADAFGDARRLALFSQWITPPVYPRRYNAHFFVARAGADQRAVADAVETHDGVWIEPARALRESEARRFSLVYPTIKHLERLAQFEDVETLMNFARAKTIRTVMPQTPGEAEFSLPGDLEAAW